MKTHIIFLSIMLVGSITACQKDVMDTALTNSIIGSDGITNFLDLTGSGFDRADHPLYQALDPHRYYFEVRAEKFAPSENRTDHVLLYPNFENAGSGNVGDIQMGRYIISPGPDNQYTGSSGAGAAETDPQLLVDFGKNTSFSFKGVQGETDPFSGTLHFPKPVEVSNVSDFSTAKEISRKENYTLLYEADGQNDGLPLVVSVNWDYLADPASSGKYRSVTNLIMTDDNGKLTLSEDMFKDLPVKAQSVSVTLRRGNAVEDSQGLFFIAVSEKRVYFNLKD